MRVLVCCDSFKGTFTAAEATVLVAGGVRRGLGDGCAVEACPGSDGGEGFARIVSEARGGRWVVRRVTGPTGGLVEAGYGVVGGGRVGVVDAASACGLGSVGEGERAPGRLTTRGVGELIAGAMADGVEEVVLGVGGTATMDGGVGVLAGLGGVVRGADGGVVEAIGDRLGEVVGVEAPVGSALEALRAGRVRLVVAVDVGNGLLGEGGGARVYGPQKGASAGDVERLDAGLRGFAGACGGGVDAGGFGMGAAGGMAFGLAAQAGARVERGFGVWAEAVGLGSRVAGADAVVAGEGCVDGTSGAGKLVGGVVEAAVGAGRACAVVGARVRAEGVGVIRGLGGVVRVFGCVEGGGVAGRREVGLGGERAGLWLGAVVGR